MKTFLRVLSFANHLPRRLFFFFVYSLIGTLFSLFNLVLMIPMLRVLFDKAKDTTPPPFPKFELSSKFLSTAFNHFFLTVVQHEGRMGALIFLCGLLVGCAFLAGLFRYMERVVATKIRVDLVKNIRLKIFERLTLMHIGFFNTHPKGDLISRFMGDVLEVEGAIMNSLKVIFKEPVTIIVFFVGLFTLSPKLTLFTLVVLPILGLVIAGIIRSLKRQAKESQESLGRIINIIDETIGGMRIIKSFNARHFIRD
ncbi:MAG: ABC transporter transmembrane domain-containing protein, partial [Flammeovirgaceae bacterium]